jgi:hypothetical protein
MDRRTALRKQREKLDHLYIETGLWDEGCIYCGADATSFDHVPPLIYTEQVIEAGLEVINLCKYPCCHECNSILGKIFLTTLRARRAYIIERIRKKYRHCLAIPAWDNEELSKVSTSMREDISRHVEFSLFIKNRLYRLRNPGPRAKNYFLPSVEELIAEI